MTIQHSSLPTHEDVYLQIQQYSEKISDMVKIASSLHVEKRSDVNKALHFAAEARLLSKKIDEIRKEITKPSRDFTASINDTAKSFTDKLDKIETFLLQKIDWWKDSVKETEELYNLIDEGIVLENTDVLRTDNVIAYEKSYHSFQVLDIEKVPYHYLKVDEAQVDLMLKAGVKNIPGIMISHHKKTILRTK